MFGDMNWLDDFQGLCRLPPGWWAALATPMTDFWNRECSALLYNVRKCMKAAFMAGHCNGGI